MLLNNGNSTSLFFFWWINCVSTIIHTQKKNLSFTVNLRLELKETYLKNNV